MSPALKAFLALVFVVAIGAILIRPILDADGTTVAAPDEEPSPGPTPTTAASPSPRPSPSPAPTATPSGGLISGPFRTQPLFDRYPSRCLQSRAPSGEGTQVAVTGPDGVAVSELDGSGRRTIGEKGGLGFSLSGGRLAVRGESGEVSVYDFLDGEPPLSEKDVDLWAYSPTTSCAVAVQKGQLVAEPTGPGRAVLVDGSVESFALSPDARRIAVVLEEGKTTSVWVADLKGITMREVHRMRTGPRVAIKGWSPDERTLYASFAPGSGLSFITITDTSAPPLSGGVVAAPVASLEQCGDRLLGIVNGAIADISTRGPDYLTQTNAGYTAVSCAPNGSFIAAIRDDNLFLLDGNGRELRDLTLDSGFDDVFVDWGDSGAGLLFGRVPDGGGVAQVWHIPEGGSARNTGLTSGTGVDWAASPPTGIPAR